MDWGDYDYKYLFFQQVDSFSTQLTIIEFCQLNESVADMLCISQVHRCVSIALMDSSITRLGLHESHTIYGCLMKN
jgi:hypothetical protein